MVSLAVFQFHTNCPLVTAFETPSTKNSTLETPMLSVAIALTATVPETVEPSLGDVIDTTGGTVS